MACHCSANSNTSHGRAPSIALLLLLIRFVGVMIYFSRAGALYYVNLKEASAQPLRTSLCIMPQNMKQNDRQVGALSAGKRLRPELCQHSDSSTPFKSMVAAVGDASASRKLIEMHAAGARRDDARHNADVSQIMVNPFRFATHEKAIAQGEPYTHPCFGHLNEWASTPRVSKFYNAASSEKWTTSRYDGVILLMQADIGHLSTPSTMLSY